MRKSFFSILIYFYRTIGTWVPWGVLVLDPLLLPLISLDEMPSKVQQVRLDISGCVSSGNLDRVTCCKMSRHHAGCGSRVVIDNPGFAYGISVPLHLYSGRVASTSCLGTQHVDSTHRKSVKS